MAGRLFQQARSVAEWVDTEGEDMRSRLLIMSGLCLLAGLAAGAALAVRKSRSSDLGGWRFCSGAAVRYCLAEQEASGAITLPGKTAYWQSRLEMDEQGLPVSVGPEGQRFRNPSSIAFAWFSRANTSFEEACRAYAPAQAGQAARAYLERTAVPIAGGAAITWHYDYETQINDVLLRPPWASAFAQAAIVERLLLHHCKTGEAGYAELARQAGRAFTIPVSAGGVRSENEDFVWFQEVPLPDRHNPFIVNAHLYAVENLLRLDKLFPDEGFRALAEKGMRAFRRALPAIDTGDWTRYDLRPRYSPVTVRIEGAGLLRAASLEARPGGREVQPVGRGDGFATIATARLPEQGLSLAGKPFDIRLDMSFGREFSPGLLEVPLRLRLSFAGAAGEARVSVASARPGEVAFVQLPGVETLQRLPDGTSLAAPVGLADLGWGQVAPEYIPFHAHLLAEIAHALGDPALFLRALRWELFARRHGEAAARKEPGRRWPWTEDAELAAAVFARFGERRPAEIRDAELREVIAALSVDAARKAAAIQTLPVGELEQ